MKKISLLVLLAMLLVLVFTATACGDDCTHVDADDNGKCDNCGADFEDGDDNKDEGCKSHVDADDNGICDNDGCGAVFCDGDANGKHFDNDGNGVCDVPGCNKTVETDDGGNTPGGDDPVTPGPGGDDDDDDPVTPGPGGDDDDDPVTPGPGGDDECIHVDADDDYECDECGDIFDDGHDVHYDANDDLACDEPGCDEACDDGCDVHEDKNDDGVCDTDDCDEPCDDGCDNHVDKNDDGMCDNVGCTESCNDGCDNHVDKNDDGLCDNAGCIESWDDGCDNHKDKNDDGVCDVDGCDEPWEDEHDVHYDNNHDGVCDYEDCDQVLDVKSMTVSEALSFLAGNASLVKGGTITVAINNSGAYSTNLTGAYILDDGYCFIMYNDGFDDIEEWYWKTPTGVWSVVNRDGSIVKNPNSYTEDNVKGFYIDGGSTNWDVQASFGAENFLANLYNFGIDTAFAYTESNNDGTFTFSYAFIDYADQLGVTTVTFSLDDDGYLVSLEQKFEQYSPTGVTVTYEVDDDGEFVLDLDGNKIPVSYEINAGASKIKDHTLIVNQYDNTDDAALAGATSAEVAGKDYGSKVVLDFKLSYNGSIVDANNPIAMEKGNTYVFEVVDLYPSTADFSFDGFRAYDSEGNWIWDTAYLTTKQENGKWYISIKLLKDLAPETTSYWQLSGSAFTFDLAVAAPSVEVSTIAPSITLPDNTTTSNTTVNIYLDQIILIGATVNTGAVNTFVAALGGDYENVLLEQISNTACEFSASATGTYVITITSTEDESVYTTVTVNVTEKAPVPDIDISGTYVATSQYGGNVTVVIDDVNFTAAFTYVANLNGDVKTIVYTYEYADGAITLYLDDAVVNPLQAAIEIDQTTGEVVGFVVVGNEYSVSNGAQSETIADGEYVGSNADSGDEITLTVSGNSVTFYYMNPISMVVITDTFDYTLIDGVVTLTLDGDTVEASLATLTVVDGAITECSYKGVTYVFEDSEVGGDDPIVVVPGELFLGSNTVTITDADVEGEGAATFIFTVTAAGTYTFESNDVLAIVYDASGIMLGRGQVPLNPGTYTVKLVPNDGVAGDFELKITLEGAGGEENTLNDLLADKTFESDTHTAYFYYAEGLYWVNIWANDGSFDAYYYYNVDFVDETYGDIYLTLTFVSDYWANPAEDPIVVTEAAVINMDGYVLNINQGQYEIPEKAEEEPTNEDILVGKSFVGATHSAMFYYDVDAGVYLMNVWSDDYDVYYTYTVASVDPIYGDLELYVTFYTDYWLNSVNEDPIGITSVMVLCNDGVYTVNINESTIEIPEEGNGGDVGGDDEPIYTTLVEGVNSIGGTNTVLSFYADSNGTLIIELGNFIMAPVTATYSVNFGDAIELVANTPVELKLSEGDMVTVTVTTDGGYGDVYATWEAESSTGSDTTDLVLGNNAINEADVVYSYTAEADGTLTLSYPSFIMTETGSITYSVNGADAVAVEAGVDAVIALKAGDVVIINVVAGGGYATLHAAWEDASSGDSNTTDLVLGSNAINEADVVYSYTAAADGTLTLNYPSFIMTETGSITYSVNGADAVTVEAGVDAVIELKAGDVVIINVVAGGGYATLNAAWAEAGVDDGSVSLTLGNNAINAADVIYSYTADAAGWLNISMGGAVMGSVSASYSINGGDAVELALSTAVDVELAAGDRIVITVVAEGYSSITASWTAKGSGTESDPYNLKELPSEITFYSDTVNKVYYTFVATESGKITFTYPTADSWCDIFEMDGTNTTANSTSSSMSETMTFDIEAGKTYRFSLGTWANEGDVTVTIAVTTDEGGEEGGDVVVAGPDGTWIGAFNGRGMMVVIDTAAGTMVVTRAKANSTTDFGQQTSYTYTYSLVDGVVTYTNDGSYSPITSMTFDENGCPLTVIWMGGTYADFVLQA